MGDYPDSLARPELQVRFAERPSLFADRFLPADLRGRHATLQWLMWQMGGVEVVGHSVHGTPIAEKVDHARIPDEFASL